MKKKWVLVLSLLLVVGGVVAQGISKRRINQQYQDFTIQKQNIKTTSCDVKLKSGVHIIQISQTADGKKYTANITIKATQRQAFSVSDWYLDEGPNQQPNQILDFTTDGKKTKQLHQGKNLVRLTLHQREKNTTPHLVIIVHRSHGNYLKCSFLA